MNVLPSLMFLAGVRLGENDHTRRVAVQKVTSSDRTDLALGKESSRRNRAEPLLHDPAIVMGLAEESLSTPATAEQEGSEWGTLVFRSILSQEKVQVVARRLRIAKVELHGLAFLNDVSDRDGSGLLIRSDEVSNKEVAPLEMTSVLIDHDAQMQRAVGIAALGSPQGFEDVLEPFQGRDAAQFIDHVLLRSRHDEPFADRTAALRGHGSHGDWSGELHSHHASVEALIIEEQSILSRVLASAGKASANFAVRVPVGHEGQDFLHRCRKGISEEEKGRVLESRLRPPRHADLVLQLRHGDLERSQCDIRKARDPDGQGCSGFNFFGAGDDTFTGTTQTDLRPQFPLQHG